LVQFQISSLIKAYRVTIDRQEPSLFAARQELLGSSHLDVANSLNNLASLYRSQGKYNEAEPLHLQALALRQKLLGDSHPDVAASLNNLAKPRHNQNRYNDAEALLIQSLKIQEISLGDNHPDTQNTKKLLAYIQANHQSLPIFGQDVT